jgi:hypothetical protein
MATVTNAQVEYSRMTRPGDFEHRNPKVSFSIQLDPGDDHVAMTRQIMHDAVELAEEAATGKITLAEMTERVAAAEPPARRGRGPNKPKETPLPATATDVTAAQQVDAADDMGMGPTQASTGSLSPTPPSGTSASSEIAEISDKQLQAAVAPISQKMREQTAKADGGPGNITALIAAIHEFADGDDPNRGLSKIPQAKRPDFLVAIKALVEPQAQTADGIPL